MSDSETEQHNKTNFSAPQSPDNAPLSPTLELKEIYNRDNEHHSENSNNSYVHSTPASPTPAEEQILDNPESPPASPPASPQSSPASPAASPLESPGASPIASPQASPTLSSPTSRQNKTKVHIDSDDDENEAGGPSTSRKRVILDSDNSDNDEPPTKRLISSDLSEDDDNEKANKQNLFGDDSDDDEEKQISQRISNENDNEVTEINEPNYDDDAPKAQSDDDDNGIQESAKRRRDDDDDDRGFEWDFDVMLREKKADRKKRSKKNGKDGGIDIINDDDGLVTHLVEKMKAAAKADRNANVEKKPAFQKIKLLPEVKNMMNRAGIVDALVENGFMSAISEWLAPLPDKCLPALDIRITILKLLHNPRFWKLDRSTLKHSGLGKAVMLLYKHPNETKANKIIANKLIAEWARPIFQLDTDFSSMTKEERVERDFERMPDIKKKKLNNRRGDDDDDDDDEDRKRPKIKETSGLITTKSGQLKPGDKGYVNRARVPKPSTKDYVIRPKWNVEGECKDRKATGTRRYDQAFREFQERTKKSNAARSVKVSLEGRNLEI